MDGSVGSSGQANVPAVQSWVSDKLERQARTMKQSRLWSEEHRGHRDHQGEGRGGGAKGDGGRGGARGKNNKKYNKGGADGDGAPSG